MEALVLPRIRIIAAVLLATLVASSLAVRVLAADQGGTSGDLAKTQQQLAQVEAVLRDARANAVAVTAAFDQATAAVATARQRLQDAQQRLEAARTMRIAAEATLTQVTSQAQATQLVLDDRARAAYMSGGATSLSVLVNAENLPDLVDRTVTLDYVSGVDHDTLQQLQEQRREVAQARAQLAGIEQERASATATVAGQVTSIEHVLALRQQAKQRVDAKIAQLAGQAADLRAHSTELRQLIQQEQAQQAAAAQSGTTTGTIGMVGALCDLSSTSAAERWIIMHESGGNPRAQNPTSTAFGLGQLLLGNRILYLGKDFATIDCTKQLFAFRSYVHDRYGTAEVAQAFWEAHGWY